MFRISAKAPVVLPPPDVGETPSAHQAVEHEGLHDIRPRGVAFGLVRASGRRRARSATIPSFSK